MRDKFNNARDFVWRHRTAAAYLAGCVVGSTVTVMMIKNKPQLINVFLEETPDQLLAMFEQDGVIDLIGEKTTVIIHSGIDPKLFQ